MSATSASPVPLSAPCECDEPSLLDVAALVSRFAADNDNDSIGLEPDALGGLSGALSLRLGCGVYTLRRITGAGPVELVVDGRAALFVEGNLSLSEPLVVRLEGEGGLDLFVAGNVQGEARWELGSGASPARVRLYVGGSGTLQLSGGGLVAGNLYAPRAELIAPADLEIFGSLFVRRLVAAGPHRLHYDRAVLDVGARCDDPPGAACTSCLDCRNQACVGGSCGACRDDDDCCAPLRCARGMCLPELF